MESNYQQGDHLDLLWGAKEIAQFLRLSERQARHQIELGLLPVRRQKRLIVASKSELRAHFRAANIAAPPVPVAAPSAGRPQDTEQHATAEPSIAATSAAPDRTPVSDTAAAL